MCRSENEGGRRCLGHSPAGKKLAALQAKKQYWAKKGDEGQAEQAAETLHRLKTRLRELEATGATLHPHQLPITEPARQVLGALRAAGLQPYVVGGSVRDSLLGQVPKDVDVEVYGGSTEQVAAALRTVGAVDEVGVSFGVLKTTVGGEEFDVSLPRTDSKTDAGGHKGFDVTVNQDLTIQEATARRDFTVNALMWDDELAVVVDAHGGLADMDAKVLRHVSEAFDEDPLRVLRGIQMSSRFGMTLHPDTVEKAATLSPQFSSLAKERVQTEFQKLFDKGHAHHTAFKLLVKTGWAEHFPGVTQAMEKGDLPRSLQTLSVMMEDGRVPKQKRALLSQAVIASHLNDDDARATLSYSGVGDGVKAQAFQLSRVELPAKQGNAQIRAFAHQMPRGLNVQDWVLANRASGVHSPKKVAEIAAKAEKLGVFEAPEQPWVKGDELVALTTVKKPGRWMRQVVDAVRAAQYDRQFRTREEALVWVEKNKHLVFPADVPLR